MRAPLSDAARLPFEDSPIEPAEAGLPTLSLVLPVLNVGPLFERTLRSLLLQDLTGVEVILMDGGSRDETLSIAEAYREVFAVVRSEPDRGQSDAINKGFAVASGAWLGWLNGDDLLMPNALTAVRHAARDAEGGAVAAGEGAARGGPHVIVGDAVLADLSLAPIGHYRYGPDRLRFAHLLDYGANHLVQPAVFFSRTAWDAVGPLPENLHFAMDADLFLGMAARFPIRHVAEELAISVYHDGCKTVRHRGASLAELALVIARHGGLEEARGVLRTMAAEARRVAPDDGGRAEVLRRRLAAERAEAAANRGVVLGG